MYKKKAEDKHSRKVAIGFTPEEYANIERAAQAMGIPITATVRLFTLQGFYSVDPDKDGSIVKEGLMMEWMKVYKKRELTERKFPDATWADSTKGD